MSNVCAGIGRGQMTVLDDRVAQRRSNFEFYKSKLSNLKGVSFHNEPEGSFSNRWLTCIIVNPTETNGVTREDIRLALDKKNIESRPLWKPMHLQPVFENYPFYGDGTSARLFENGLCLPSGSNLTITDLELVVSTILEVLNQK